jgi:putative serine protease PepD
MQFSHPKEPLMHDSPTSEPRKRLPRTLTAFALVAAVGAGTGIGAYAIADSGNSDGVAASASLGSGTIQPAALLKSAGSSSLVDLYKRTSPGVVDIVVTTSGSGNSDSFFGQPQQSQSTKAEGTGFVVDSKGDIVTNYHVVTGATSITVKFQNGKSTKGTLVGSDSGTDLAVIKVDPSATTLAPLTLGDSSSVQTGQSVFAIGSPFGLADSLSAGIVSATGRQMQAPNGKTIVNAIQTDAAINHGNSGGPLLDATGKVIGVNSQIESESGGSDGVGFAIPVNTVKSVATQLIAGQKVTHPFLGVYLSDASGGGATITKLTAGGPADTAGIKVGDVITAVDSTTITSSSDLVTAISADTVGQKVTLTLTRDGASQQIAVTLGVTSS